jgi:hypothetical protein
MQNFLVSVVPHGLFPARPGSICCFGFRKGNGWSETRQKVTEELIFDGKYITSSEHWSFLFFSLSEFERKQDLNHLPRN